MVTATPDASSLAEVLDRILDKGIVVDVWARVSLVGIEILTIEARVVVASWNRAGYRYCFCLRPHTPAGILSFRSRYRR